MKTIKTTIFKINMSGAINVNTNNFLSDDLDSENIIDQLIEQLQKRKSYVSSIGMPISYKFSNEVIQKIEIEL